MFNILTKEINSFLNSLVAYIVIGVFLTGVGLLMWVFPESNVLDYGYADMGTLFNLGPFMLMFLIPSITMRMIAEEVKTGTFEILAVKPITTSDIVLGKYFSGLLLTVVAILPTIVYYFSIYSLSSPVGNIDSAGIIGSYLGLILLSSVFVAVGIFASTTTDNQVVAFIFSSFLCFILFTGLNSLANINLWASVSLLLSSLSLEYHYNSLSRGLIDSRDIVYFISIDVLFLSLTTIILNKKR